MDIVVIIGASLFGYLMGAISFTRIVLARYVPGKDLSDVSIPIEGVKEPMRMTSVSANTAGLAYGPRVGGLIGVLDMLKVFLPTLIVRLLFPGQPYLLFTALFGIIGHNWPVYYGFKGGRGISAIFGGLLAIDPLGALVAALGGWVIGILVLRDFAYVFPLSLLLIIPWLWITTGNPLYALYGLLANVLFAVAIIPEVKEVLRARKEMKRNATMEEMMQTNPMGRMMLDIQQKLKRK